MATHTIVFGHGQGDPGAVGNGYTEANFTRDVLGPRLRHWAGQLKHNKIEFYNPSLDMFQETQRGRGAYTVKTASVTEFHLDAASRAATGGHVIISSRFNPDKNDLAIAKVVGDYVGWWGSVKNSKGINRRNNLLNLNTFADLGVSYRLVELGFITNPRDVKVLVDNIDAIAKRMVEAITGETIGGSASKPAPKPSAPSKPAPSKPKQGYFTSAPAKVRVKVPNTGLYGINDVDFKKGHVGGTYGPGTVFVITGMKKSNGGTPRLVTQSGYLITANKNYVEAIGGSSSAPAPKPAPKPSGGGSITKGSKVQVTNPVDYNGTRLAVSGTYDVIEVSGDRIVIARSGQVIAAIHRNNLKLVSGGGASAPAPKRIVNGGNVQVTNPRDIHGTSLGVSGTYKVMELHSNYAVIGRGGVVTAAVPLGNLKAV